MWQGLQQFVPWPARSNRLWLLQTLALLIKGLLGSKHCHVPRLAVKTPLPIKLESRVVKLKRFLTNERVSHQTFWLLFARQLIEALTSRYRELVIALDGSIRGQSCVALVASLAYAGRNLPITWLVVKGKKVIWHRPNILNWSSNSPGYLSLTLERCFWVTSRSMVPSFYPGPLNWAGATWYGLLRTTHCTPKIRPWALRARGRVGVPPARFTQAHYGPVLAMAVWDARCDEPLYLVCILACPYLARDYYARRERTLCNFSDYKSRGFRLDKSHLANPARFSRLRLDAVLALRWLTYLGVAGREQYWDQQIHRTEFAELGFSS